MAVFGGYRTYSFDTIVEKQMQFEEIVDYFHDLVTMAARNLIGLHLF